MALSPWQLCFHADLKCHVRSCNNKRITNSAVFSPYCKHHICTVGHKSNSCFKRGHGEDRVCHHHNRCEHTLSGRRCRSPKKGHDPGFRFCIEHGCTQPDCKEQRSKKGSSYCTKHACSVKDCDQPRKKPGLYCRKHTCHGRGCVNCVDPSLSSSNSSSSGRYVYCHGHQICEVDGCDAFVLLDASNRAAMYCFRHYCAASPGCGGRRVEGEAAQGCRDHTCALYPTCSLPRADPIRGLFCADHECADAGCRKQIYDSGVTSTWCADHMCMAALTRREDCANRREGTATNPVYCADHEPCEEAGCEAFRAMKGRGERMKKCEEHLTTKCAFPTCVLDAEASTTTCRYHTCQAPGCLAALSPSLFSYPSPTPSSTFLFPFPPTTPAAPSPSSPFCDTHRCMELGCVNPRLAALTIPVPAANLATAEGGGMYCLEHACRSRHGRCAHQRRGCRHRHCRHGVCFRASASLGGEGCGSHGGDDESSDDSDGDGSVTDHGDECCGGGSGGGGAVEVDVGACFNCADNVGDCGGDKKCRKCT